jgi:exodeoxyribonuclease VII large subunit
VIGIVTGAETAALQDVLNVLGRRYPLARVILASSPVQGEQAPARLIAALESLQRGGDCDVILLVRGGGSLEDLWCFNDERLARVIAASTTPIVTGIGHEIDFTLADFAADLRAPTPSAAAELVTPITMDDLRMAVDRMRARLAGAFAGRVVDARHGLDLVTYQLAGLSPRRQIIDARLDADALMARAARAMRGGLALQKSRLGGVEKALNAVNPLATLARGYAIVTDSQGSVVRRVGDAAPGDVVNIRLHDGSLTTTVTDQQTGTENG